MKNFVVIILGTLFLASCQPDADTTDTKQSCQGMGGKVMNARIGQVCSMPASDAGKSCSDSNQCSGLCMGDGQCSEFESNFGCHNILENGQNVTICID